MCIAAQYEYWLYLSTAYGQCAAPMLKHVPTRPRVLAVEVLETERRLNKKPMVGL